MHAQPDHPRRPRNGASKDAPFGARGVAGGENRQKISFVITATGQGAYETLHAIQEDGNQYRLDNIPFFAYGISCGDLVSAFEDDGLFVFEAILQHSGNSTYRVKLSSESSHADFLRFWPRFEKFGCSYEGTTSDGRNLYAINVPNTARIEDVYRELEILEDEGRISFEEGHYCGPPEL